MGHRYLGRIASIGILMLGLALLSVAGCSDTEPTQSRRTAPAGLLDDPLQIRLGEQLFLEKCADCHGKPSEGRSGRAAFFEPPAPDFTEPHYQDVSPSKLFWRIEVGKTVEPFLSRGSVMPAWRPYLSDEQIWQLVAYLKTRPH